MTGTLKYGELFLNAKHGETYEIVNCNVGELMGKKVTMKKTGAGNLIMKKEGTLDSVDIDDIVTPYGGITGATYKKVVTYEKVKLGDALNALSNGDEVFIKLGSDYVEVDDRDPLYEEYNIFDFEDLLESEFFIRN